MEFENPYEPLARLLPNYPEVNGNQVRTEEQAEEVLMQALAAVKWFGE